MCQFLVESTRRKNQRKRRMGETEISRIERIHIHGPNVPQNDVQYVLDNITPTNKLLITAETNEKLPWRIEGTFEQIRIGSGSWITVDHAMNFSFPYVAVMGTTITNQELNLILKNWIDMKCHLKTKTT
ncbi:hypothetical protein L5515_013484 [Caenorhabditis briggsae]|uniref:Sdz-33 F-box domain-containing protein n=1 Tax=Caenorhabditis briggsae TaxID=6238 RepID=A0AAE9E8T8_CAEBR|nr:hypothetical protein L5515_013484 [Caenorhabditis briggsae]